MLTINVKNHPAKNKILNDLVLRKKEQNAFQKRKSWLEFKIYYFKFLILQSGEMHKNN